MRRALREVGYLPDKHIASVVYLAEQLAKPVLIEGSAGTGKTELAKSVTLMSDDACTSTLAARRPSAIRQSVQLPGRKRADGDHRAYPKALSRTGTLSVGRATSADGRKATTHGE